MPCKAEWLALGAVQGVGGERTRTARDQDQDQDGEEVSSGDGRPVMIWGKGQESDDKEKKTKN